VFDEILGLPMHPLMVHFAVVLIPLLAVGAVVYALVPRFRSKIDWAVTLLAFAGPGAAFFARESGQELEQEMIERQVGADVLANINDHQAYGDLTFWFSLGLGLGTLLMVIVTVRRGLPSWLTWALSGAVVVLAGVTGTYAFLTGDSGANAVWGWLA
jgi:uncharacterized membrane protein